MVEVVPVERLVEVLRSRVLGPELDGVGPEVVSIEQRSSQLDESGVHAEEVGCRRRERERHDPPELAPEAAIPLGIEIRVEVLPRRQLDRRSATAGPISSASRKLGMMTKPSRSKAARASISGTRAPST